MSWYLLPSSPTWLWWLNVGEIVPLVGCIPPESEHEWLARIGGKASTGFGRDKGEAKRGPLYTCILLSGAGAATGEWYDSVVDTGDTGVAIGGNWRVLPLLMLEWPTPIGLGWRGSSAGKGGLRAYSTRLTLFLLNPVTDDKHYPPSFAYFLIHRLVVGWGRFKGVWPRRRWVAAYRRGRWCRVLMFSRRARWRKTSPTKPRRNSRSLSGRRYLTIRGPIASKSHQCISNTRFIVVIIYDPRRGLQSRYRRRRSGRR